MLNTEPVCNNQRIEKYLRVQKQSEMIEWFTWKSTLYISNPAKHGDCKKLITQVIKRWRALNEILYALHSLNQSQWYELVHWGP